MNFYEIELLGAIPRKACIDFKGYDFNRLGIRVLKGSRNELFIMPGH